MLEEPKLVIFSSFSLNGTVKKETKIEKKRAQEKNEDEDMELNPLES